MSAAVMWFRRDLRVADNLALRAASDGAEQVVALFVLDPVLLGSRRVGAPRLSYLCDALADLDGSLRDRGGRLVVRRGDPRAVVPAVAAETSAGTVHWSAEFTPYGRSRDTAVAAVLRSAGVGVAEHSGVLVHDPGSVATSSGKPYRVFTPFHRHWRSVPVGAPLDAPARLPDACGPEPASEPLPTVTSLLVTVSAEVVAGGERRARARLDHFLSASASHYRERRNVLAAGGTSRLSADLKYGCLSPRAVYAGLDQSVAGHEAFGTELAWRDFYGHVMARWPQVRTTEFNPGMRGLAWRGDSEDLAAWREGRTGYPLVDAGMRQLLAEAWMHNRARMVVASFLCKHLLIDWRLGESHFLRHLVDGDVASNNGGWQWAAGTGTDAQPYFRMFNPVRQGEQFDPDGAYVRRYVPELRPVPDRWLHHPWDMPEEVAATCGVRVGVDYPEPIVDHHEARQAALAFFARARRL